MEETERFSAPMRGLPVASCGLGFFSMVVFWWFPFGMMLATGSIILGAISLLLGIKGSTLGQNLALIGLSFGMTGLGTGVILYRGLHLLLVDYIAGPQQWQLF